MDFMPGCALACPGAGKRNHDALDHTARGIMLQFQGILLRA